MVRLKELWIIVTSAIVLIVCEADPTPTITYISPPIVTRSGSTIDMDCSAADATEYPILWMKLPAKCSSDHLESTCTSIPLSSGSSLIVRDPRYSLRFDTVSSTYTLQIRDVHLSDEATFQCQILVAIGEKVTKEVKLKVNHHPIIHDNTSSVVIALENSSAELNCDTFGVPVPSVKWHRGTNTELSPDGIQQDGNTLIIYPVKKSDRGVYFCVADNGVGKPAVRNVSLDVEFDPVVQGGGQISHDIGSSLEMACHVEGNPMPNITWYHQQNPLTSDHNVIVDTGFLIQNRIVETTLRVEKLDNSRLGVYTCRAQNKLGTDEKEFVVIKAMSSNCQLGQCDHFSSSKSANYSSHSIITLFAIITIVDLFTQFSLLLHDETWSII